MLQGQLMNGLLTVQKPRLPIHSPPDPLSVDEGVGMPEIALERLFH